MSRSFKYLAFAGSSVLSCVVAYKLQSGVGNEVTRVVHAAGTSAEVLRSTLENQTKQWDKNWDFREPARGMNSSRKFGNEKSVPSLAEHSGDEQTPRAADAGGKPSVTRHLVFIRHGQYAKGDEDKTRFLTNLGRQQAEQTGKRLQLLNAEKCSFDKIVISTMTRARETGDIIRSSLENVPHEYCDFLQEGAPCVPEPPSSNWRADNQEIFQDSARIEAAFRRYFHRADPGQKKDSVEIFVCHANVIRYFICRSLQFPVEGWLRMSIGNCGITWLSINPSGRVVLRSMGDTGHLPPNMITTS